MKKRLLTVALIHFVFFTTNLKGQDLKPEISFDSSKIEIQRGKKKIFLPINLSFNSKNIPKDSLNLYELKLKVNQKETDITNQYYKIYSKPLMFPQLEKEESFFIEVSKDTLPDRVRKLILEIEVLKNDALLTKSDEAVNQKLEILLKPYKEASIKESKEMSPPTTGPNQFYIDFVGTANLQANLSEASDEVQGAAGLGVIFERYFLHKDDNQTKLFEENMKNLSMLKEENRLARVIRRLDRKIDGVNSKIESIKIKIEESNNSTDLTNELKILNKERDELLKTNSEKSEKKIKLSEETTNIKIDRRFKRFFESLDMEAYINVASSVDSLEAELEGSAVTNSRLFGNYVLNPISSKQSVFINSDVYFNPELLWVRGNWITKWISGVNFRINASNVLWNLVDEGENKSRYAGALNLRFGLFHEFLPNDKIRDSNNRRKYSVRLGLNYTFRELTGDISSQTNDLIRNQFIGTTDTSFSGIEPSFGFRLNNIIAEFSMPMIGGAGRNDIEGLTDTQFLFSIRFVGGFSIKLDDKSSEN
ncbi:hypothetical protein ACA086_05025 [Muriicola sp. E247]|uniref:hypothetical protein n=1 Tax=Muriicola sp. E247 TaxID=3242730 RepID=UPI003525D7C8